ncbi:hypothetical protein PFBG_06126 [Plasmodium falciparum 7G8]|uniref:Rifin n=1 Tax=Plasmodium falciparum (isolate 7G8) TaxID=57266 RepID=W7F5K9_PLAF8|nr:hypothetical protein PFBG_06126 [Plasmodium falciparum 7G8]
MKFSYFNILLFSIPLNILINDHSKYSSCKHTSNSKTTKPHRSLYECGLYSPTNYDSDPEMKRVMQQFVDRTTQRFHEYEERMQSKRMQCKEQCDKEIQKIILKDKLEKELMDKFDTLHTDIQSDAIPTCVCEKSLADKVEKGCLRCGYGLGTVAPTVGLIGAVAVHVWKPMALEAAIEAAIAKSAAEISAAANAAGLKAGNGFVITALKKCSVYDLTPEISKKISSIDHYANITEFVEFINSQYLRTCIWMKPGSKPPACNPFEIELSIKPAVPGTHGRPSKYAIRKLLEGLAEEADQAAKVAADAARESATNAIEVQQTNVINAIFMSKQTAIIASVVAIVVIVLIMIIIYLILRYRRKKKMKKKAQYTKLLNE